MVGLEFALMEDELLIKWEVWEGRGGGGSVRPKAAKAWQEARGQQEKLQGSLCGRSREGKEWEIRPQSHFLGSLSNKEFQTLNIVLEPSLRGQFP